MPSGSESRVERALLAAFLSAALLQFFHPLADGDLWWHLATGRYIVDQGSLPGADPFSYTVSAAYEDRARMFVRANWLAQVGYYGLYQLGGFQALRLFNAILFVAVTAVAYRVLRMHAVGAAWAILLVAPVTVLCWYYDELRPLGFSVLSCAASLFVLERAQVQGRGARGLWPLLPLCALWANLHRGFPVMALIIVPYAAAWLWQRRLREVGALAAAGAASLLNPSLAAPWVAAVAEAFQGSQFGILELATPWEFARATGGAWASSFLPLLVVIAFASAALMVADRRALRLEHLMLWGLLAFAGATAFRYSIYFALAAVVAAAPSAGRLLAGPRAVSFERGLPAAVLATAAAIALAAEPPTRRAIHDQAVPERAVDALLRHDLPAPLLNTFDWGGYVIWRAWPRYRVYTDSRMLDHSVFVEASLGEQRGVSPLLARRGINTVIYPTRDSRWRVRPVLLELLAHPEWGLVHFDSRAALFARRSAAPFAPSASPRELSDQLLAMIAFRNRGRALQPRDRLEAAAVLRAVGREAEAARLLSTR